MSSATPLISVIVRTKDRPWLFCKAMDSLLSQTYKNLEIIVVNDGGCCLDQQLKKYSSKMIINYINRKETSGRAVAANLGLKAAVGEFVGFLDDDDVLYPHHFETLLPFAGKNTIVYSGVLSVYYKKLDSINYERVDERVEFNSDFDRDLLFFENYIPFMSLLFPIDVRDKVGEFYRDIDLFEDWDFLVRASAYFQYVHVDKISAEYRFYDAMSVKDSHSEKYDYNKALALAFNRFLPFITGKSWVACRDRGLVGRLQKDISQLEGHIEETNRKIKNNGSHILELETYIKNLERKIKNDGTHIDELTQIISNFQALVHRLESECKTYQDELSKL